MREEARPVQLDSLLKYGSLAFSVVQDDKVRELTNMLHKGARRRGWLPSAAAPTANTGAAHNGSSAAATASAPSAPVHAEKPARPRIPFELDPAKGLPWSTQGPMFGVPLGKYVTGARAGRAGHYVREVAKLLVR